jgi:hypothetical protein
VLCGAVLAALGAGALGALGVFLSQYYPVFGGIIERGLAVPWSEARLSLIPVHLFAFGLAGLFLGALGGVGVGLFAFAPWGNGAGRRFRAPALALVLTLGIAAAAVAAPLVGYAFTLCLVGEDANKATAPVSRVPGMTFPKDKSRVAVEARLSDDESLRGAEVVVVNVKTRARIYLTSEGNGVFRKEVPPDEYDVVAVLPGGRESTTSRWVPATPCAAGDALKVEFHSSTHLTVQYEAGGL